MMLSKRIQPVPGARFQVNHLKLVFFAAKAPPTEHDTYILFSGHHTIQEPCAQEPKSPEPGALDHILFRWEAGQSAGTWTEFKQASKSGFILRSFNASPSTGDSTFSTSFPLLPRFFMVWYLCRIIIVRKFIPLPLPKHLTKRLALACRADPGRAFCNNKEVNISSLLLNHQK